MRVMEEIRVPKSIIKLGGGEKKIDFCPDCKGVHPFEMEPHPVYIEGWNEMLDSYDLQ